MANHNLKELDAGQLEMMWNFLRFGYQEKPHIPVLKEHLDAIRQMMVQKTAGQEGYSDSKSITFDDLPTHINCVVIEAMCLYLSGALDKLEENSELKRLLRVAVDDFDKLANVESCYYPFCGERCPFDCTGGCEEREWKHRDEAMKLLGGTENVEN